MSHYRQIIINMVVEDDTPESELEDIVSDIRSRDCNQ